MGWDATTHKTHPYIPSYTSLYKSPLIRTKKGDQMAFLSVSDGINKLDVTLFPEDQLRQMQKNMQQMAETTYSNIRFSVRSFECPKDSLYFAQKELS